MKAGWQQQVDLVLWNPGEVRSRLLVSEKGSSEIYRGLDEVVYRFSIHALILRTRLRSTYRFTVVESSVFQGEGPWREPVFRADAF